MKVTEAEVQVAIVRTQFHRFEGTNTTICCLTLDNGFNAVGKSGCVDPSEFNEQIGRDLAARDAFSQAWAYLGFRLAERLHAQREG